MDEPSGIEWNGLTEVTEETDYFFEGYKDVPLKLELEYNETFTEEFREMLYGGPNPTSPAFAMRIESKVCPLVAPYKRRGLTGKAYRIARRRYHREMRAWARGLIPAQEIVQVFYDVRPIEMAPVPGRPDEVSVQFSVH